jgi:hypothetical protein
VTRSGWARLGALVGLLTAALVAWCAVALARGRSGWPVRAPLGAAILLLTMVKLLDDRLHRSWPAWLGLGLATAIAVTAWRREGPDRVPARRKGP